MTICFCCSSYMTISKVAVGFKLLTKQNKQSFLPGCNWAFGIHAGKHGQCIYS